jgi:hypothetical protein
MTTVRNNESPAVAVATSRNVADQPETRRRRSTSAPSAVPSSEARRRRRWYLVALSSFATV